MAVTCPYCRGTDVVYGFDLIQCLECAGHFKFDGTPSVPTSALASDGTYDGPGKEMVDDPSDLPFKATEARQR